MSPKIIWRRQLAAKPVAHAFLSHNIREGSLCGTWNRYAGVWLIADNLAKRCAECKEKIKQLEKHK